MEQYKLTVPKDGTSRDMQVLGTHQQLSSPAGWEIPKEICELSYRVLQDHAVMLTKIIDVCTVNEPGADPGATKVGAAEKASHC